MFGRTCCKDAPVVHLDADRHDAVTSCLVFEPSSAIMCLQALQTASPAPPTPEEKATGGSLPNGHAPSPAGCAQCSQPVPSGVATSGRSDDALTDDGDKKVPAACRC